MSAQPTSSSTSPAVGATVSQRALAIQEQIEQDLREAPLPMWERRVPFVVLFSLVGFVLASCVAFYVAGVKSPSPGTLAFAERFSPVPILFLVVLTTSFGIWFILAFTGSPLSRAKQRECFRFAYSFTITTFIILTFPYLDVWKPDISGPIGLVRGCIASPLSGERTLEPIGPRSILCPASPSDARDAAGATAQAQPDKAPAETYAYPWLLTIGGFVGTTICTKGNETVACDPNKQTDPYRHSRITSGLVVPFYVVFLAFVGGAVSLSRRIPEYQKRSDENYVVVTGGLAPLKPHEVRESVVFQIMQLISAPFIAITAYWAIAPSTVPATIGLAFVSGFSSETILLVIRGMVDGIRPQSTLFAGARTVAGKSDDAKAAKYVKVGVEVQADVPLDSASLSLTVDEKAVTLTPEGAVELRLEIGRAYALVATGRSQGGALRAQRTFTPTAEDEGKTVTLELVWA